MPSSTSISSDNKSTNIDASPDPYRQFLSLASFVASIGLGLSLGSSLSLASTTSFLGRSDAETLAKVHHCSLIFAWSAAAYGLGLITAMPGQVLVTSPHFVKMYMNRENSHKGGLLKFMFASMSWVSMGLVTAGTALVGEGLKLVSKRAGQALQWTLLAVGFPLLAMWLYLRHENFIFHSLSILGPVNISKPLHKHKNTGVIDKDELYRNAINA